MSSILGETNKALSAYGVAEVVTLTAETERERMIHAVYDALKWLDAEAEAAGDNRYAGVARAILRGQLDAVRHPHP